MNGEQGVFHPKLRNDQQTEINISDIDNNEKNNRMKVDINNLVTSDEPSQYSDGN